MSARDELNAARMRVATEPGLGYLTPLRVNGWLDVAARAVADAEERWAGLRAFLEDLASSTAKPEAHDLLVTVLNRMDGFEQHPVALILLEKNSEIARLKAELDSYQGRKVMFTMERAAPVAMTSMSANPEAYGLEEGVILRATDTGREWVFREGRFEDRIIPV